MSSKSALPFDRYRSGGRVLLGRTPLGDGSCRRGYGPAVFAECGTDCAYCGRELGASYESWLDLSIDHVIPTETVKRLGWRHEWVDDLMNLVTACRACNEFLNGYRVRDAPPATIEEFAALRDRHFVAKAASVVERHARERAWFASWTTTFVPPISNGERHVCAPEVS